MRNSQSKNGESRHRVDTADASAVNEYPKKAQKC